MKTLEKTLIDFDNGVYNEELKYIYACTDNELPFYIDRYKEVISGLEEVFGKTDEIALFSAPGRTEIGGNHTDHQHGCVIAGSVNLDVIAAVRLNGTNTVRVKSKGYKLDEIDLDDLDIHEEQYDKAISLIRGVIKKFTEKGYKIQGFDAYTISNVLKGSGLSSSAAFEVLIGTILNGLFANNEVSPVEIAQIGQFAENVYFNKPSGLMDQMASSVGSVVSIDFKDTKNPVVKKVELDLAGCGYALCIIDSGADHADLTDEYATIPQDMKEVSKYFGKEFLRDINADEFYRNIKDIREKLHNDRAVLRAIHFINDNKTAVDEVKALEEKDFDTFLELVKKSGQSSYMYLQNIYASSMPKNQPVSVVLAMCDKLLGDRGAYRVHGGGFAGTIQAFVPLDMLDKFKNEIDSVVGQGMCHILSIRPVGGYEIK